MELHKRVDRLEVDMQKAIDILTHLTEGHSDENSMMAQHERHLTELNERSERQHRETREQIEQMLTAFQHLAQDLELRKQNREEDDRRYEKKVVQLLSHDGELVVLRGDGRIYQVVSSESDEEVVDLVPYAPSR